MTYEERREAFGQSLTEAYAATREPNNPHGIVAELEESFDKHFPPSLPDKAGGVGKPAVLRAGERLMCIAQRSGEYKLLYAIPPTIMPDELWAVGVVDAVRLTREQWDSAEGLQELLQDTKSARLLVRRSKA